MTTLGGKVDLVVFSVYPNMILMIGTEPVECCSSARLQGREKAVWNAGVGWQLPYDFESKFCGA